jgi:hypothetical protein
MREPATVAEYATLVDPAVRPIFRATRAFVRKHAPELLERISMDVHPWYFRGREGVLYLADHSKHVTLGFAFGARLRDPEGILEGTGKSSRHVKVRTKADLTPDLARLIASAAQHDAGPREEVVRFRARVEREDEGVFIVLPFDAKTRFGKARPKVEAKVGAASRVTTLASYGGKGYLGLPKAFRALAKVDVGDVVDVELRPT